jgi:hypothetical protein
VPLVLATQTSEPLRSTLLKAVAKTGLQSVLYFASFFAVAVYAIRGAVRLR